MSARTETIGHPQFGFRCDVPTFAEARAMAKREKRQIVAKVLRADDSVETVVFGPRGGWTVVKKTDT